MELRVARYLRTGEARGEVWIDADRYVLNRWYGDEMYVLLSLERCKELARQGKSTIRRTNGE